MLRFYEFAGPVIFVLWVFCIIDTIMSPEDSVRNLPKTAWVLIVLFFPFVGSIAWLAAGRPSRGPARRSAYEREAPAFPEYDRPGRMAASDPEADEAFLKRVRERADEQRRRAAEEKRRDQHGDGDLS